MRLSAYVFAAILSAAVSSAQANADQTPAITSEALLTQLPPGSIMRGLVRSLQRHGLAKRASAPTRTIPVDEIRRLAERAALQHSLPVDYFIRLIRQESGFDHAAVSRVGAQGVAQFMPSTAAERGLKNPFDPAEALPKSAELLKDLRAQFGNLGLAAAAYNAGPRRVREWLLGKGRLPRETLDYVAAVTGQSAAAWAPGAVVSSLKPRAQSALRTAGSKRMGTNPRSWEAQMLVTLMASTSSNAAAPALASTSRVERGRFRAGPRTSSMSERTLCSTCVIQAVY